MSSESFLARMNIYNNSLNKDAAEKSSELPLNPQTEENEIDSPIVEGLKLNVGQID
jgi:hypothetical protein